MGFLLGNNMPVFNTYNIILEFYISLAALRATLNASNLLVTS